MRIKEQCIAETSSEDDYGHAIVAGKCYITVNFLEKSRNNSKGHYFKVDSKASCFSHESIVYPFAEFTEKKNKFFIENYILKLLTLLSIWKCHPCLLFDFLYTILQFTSFIDI